MPVELALLAIIIIMGGGVASLLAGSRSRLATALGVGGAVAGSAVGIVPAAMVVLGAPAAVLRAPWAVPYGSFSVELDALAAFFLIPIFLLVALAAVYGAGYLRHHDAGKSAGLFWFPYAVLAASMAMVVLAQNGMLFLIAWELMALSSYFLVTHDDREERVRDAGWTYVVATHLGTAFLFAFFAVMWRETGTLDFAGWRGAALPPATAGLLFLCAVVGFGTKAGFLPLHVWLPEAHPAAPSPVSAIMSGVMLKTGIYGLVRMATYLGAPPLWWGELLVGIGAASGILGVLYALAQHDIKSLLAYHSVENIGIIALGLGMGFLGLAAGQPAVAVLGFAGGILHVLNHALFKGLLFLGAGAVIVATGSGAIDRQGGLLRRMPTTGAAFLTGSAAIAGLPPLNGFASEFLIFLSALLVIGSPSAAPSAFWPAVAVVAALALIGGLAAACFAKAFGVLFLGEPRSEAAAGAREVPRSMWGPMAVLAAACAAVGLAAPAVVAALAPMLAVASGVSAAPIAAALAKATAPLAVAVACFAALIVAALAVLSLRRRLLSGREVRAVGTWDCGYAHPTARMQYTASSFAEPFTTFFRTLLCAEAHGEAVEGIFPARASFASHARDFFRAMVYAPAFRLVGRSLSSWRWLQHGNVHLYVLYIAIALIVLLVWTFGIL